MFRKATVIIGVIGILICIGLAVLAILPWQIASIIAASIGAIAGIIQNYLPKEKEAKKIGKAMEVPKEEERKLISKDTVYVGAHGQSFSFELDNEERLEAEITSTEPIDVYILDRRNYRKWLDKKPFGYHCFTEAILETCIDFSAPKKGTWYMVFEMYGRKAAQVKVEHYLAR